MTGVLTAPIGVAQQSHCRAFPEPGHGPRIRDDKVGVLIEVRPSPKLPIQTFHDIHPICTLIARQLLDQFLGKVSVLLPLYCADRPHTATWPSLTYDAMTEKYKAIVDMRHMGFLHVQRQFELTFKESSACLLHFFRVRLGPFYDHRIVISVSAVR